MTITYSCIARGTTVLCKHQVGSGTLQSTVDSMLPNIPTRNDGKTTYKSENYLFHCLIENGMIYMCAATPQFGKNQPYNYLAEIKRQFQSGMLSMRAVNAGHLELNDDFSLIMAQEMEKFSKPDNVSKLRSQVDEVKEVMTQNIERVLERGDRLDDLVDKTEDLENSAATFQKTSRKIRKKYFWRNMKMKILIVVVVTVIIVVIVMIILATQGVFDGSSSSNNNQVPSTSQATIQNG